MGQESKRDDQQAVVKQIHETVEELQRLLQGKEPRPTGSTGELPDLAPRDVLKQFWGVASAKAGLLSELIELVLPEVKWTAKPIRSFDKVMDPARVHALETLFGSVPARLRAQSWLDVPAVRLLGGRAPKDPQGATAQDTGLILGQELYLLVDGRLALVDCVGTWAVGPHRTLLADSIIVRARVVDGEELFRHVTAELDFMFILKALHRLLHDEHPGRAQPPCADLSERRARMEALTVELGEVLEQHAARLRRVGDSPT